MMCLNAGPHAQTVRRSPWKMYSARGGCRKTRPLCVKKSAAASPKRTVIVDAGPLKAAIDRGDADHAWAVRAFRAVPARYITFEAAIAEAQHGLENHPAAM